MPWTVWMLYTFLSMSNLIKWLFWKINNNRVDSGSIWKLFDFNHLSLLLSEWHHHDFPLSFLPSATSSQGLTWLPVCLNYIPEGLNSTTLTNTLKVIYSLSFGHTCKPSTLVWCNRLLSLCLICWELH